MNKYLNRAYKEYTKNKVDYVIEYLLDGDEIDFDAIEKEYNEVINLTIFVRKNDIRGLEQYIIENKLNVNTIKMEIPYDLLSDAIDNNSSQEFIEYCMKLYDDFNYEIISISPLFLAIKHNNFKIADKLICEGANINYKDDLSGNIISYLLINSINKENLKYIIDCGVDINSNLFLNFKKKYEIYGIESEIYNFFVTNKGKKSKLKLNLNLDSECFNDNPISCFDYLIYKASKDQKVIKLIFEITKSQKFNIDSINKKSVELIVKCKFYNIIESIIEYNNEFFRSKFFEIVLDYACKYQDSYILKCLVTNINDNYKNIINNYGELLLFKIIKSSKNEEQKIKYINLMMKNGVDINIRNENSYLINESLKYHNDILAKVIIEKGANINIKDNFRKTPLMYAIENNNSSDIIELLLQKGANINDKDFNGNTPLHYACKFSNVNIVSLIMGKKPKINEQNEKGETPLIISFMERNWICAKRLLEYNDINVTIKDKNGNTILNYFKDLENDSYKFNEEIISFIKERYNTLINLNNQKIEKIESMESDDCNIEMTQEEDNDTKLINISENNNKEIITMVKSLHDACKSNNIDLVSKLILENNDINKKDNNDLTPLMISIMENNWECVLRLLECKNIEVNIMNKNNETPLFYMINNFIQQREVYFQLLKHDAYINDKDINNKSFYKKFINNDDLIHVFNDVDIIIKNNDKNTIKRYSPLIFAITINDTNLLEKFLEYHVNPNKKDNNNQETPLLFAIKNNNLEAIKILVKYNVDYKTDKQRILEITSNNKKEELLSYIYELENVDKNKIYYCTNDPLLIFKACKNEDIEGIKNMINNKNIKFDINIKNDEGLTPLIFSIKNKKYKSAEYLIDNCNDINYNMQSPEKKSIIDFFIDNKTQNRYNLLEKMINHGEYIDIKYFNKSLVDLIISNTDLIKYFIHNGIPIKDDKENRKYIIPNPLIFSVRQNNYPFVKVLLENKVSINEIDSDHKTALIYAIDNNNKSIADLLLEYNFDPNKTYDEKNITPIIYTVEKGNTFFFNYLFQSLSSDSKKKQTITSIISYSLNYNKFEMIDFIYTEFKYDINYICNIINELLKENKIDFKSKDNEGYTILHHVCSKGNLFILKELLNTQQDFNIQDNENKTPLMIAIINKKYDCAKCLFKNDILLDVNRCDNQGETAMSYLLKNFSYDKEMIKLFYDKNFYFKQDDFREESLLKYIIKCLDLLKLFIEKGIRIKVGNFGIRTIKTPVIFAVKNNIKSLLISLLNLKANVNEMDEDNKSPLYYAINYNNIDLINVLLNFNADINQKVLNGKTPLIYIIENDKKNLFINLIQNKNVQNNLDTIISTIYSYSLQIKNYDIISFLVDQLEDKNYDIYTPLDNLLNSNEYDIKQTDHKNGWNLLHYACFIGNLSIISIILKRKLENDNYIDINIQCNDGSTPLMLSIKNKKFKCTSKIIDSHPNVNIIDNFEDTPLTYMLKHNDSFNNYIFDKLIENGAYFPTKYLKEGDDLKYIINNKSVIKKITYEGIRIKDEQSSIILIKHPLLYAVKNNNFTLASELIKNGAKINDTDDNNENALYYSIINKNVEMVKLLLSHNIEIKYSPINEKSSLLMSIKHNNSNLFKLMINNISGSNKDQKIDEIVKSIIQYSYTMNNFDIIKFIHKHLDRENYSNYENINDIILIKDKNYNVKENEKIQPLHYACMEGNKNNIKSLILNKHKDVNERNYDGSTPLMVAIKNDKYEIVDLLFKLCNTIDVNITDYHNITPIVYMINKRIKNIEIYKILFSHGAYLELDFIQSSPNIDIILKSKSMNQYIKENGINININNIITKVSNLVKFSIDNNYNKLLSVLVDNSLVNIENENYENKNIIEYSLGKKNNDAFNILIKLIPKEKIDYFIMPIISNIFTSKVVSNLNILKNYTNNKSINNIINDINNNYDLYKKSGYRPLYELTLKGNFKLINDLITLNYNVNSIDDITNETALMTALKNKKFEIVEVLLNTSGIDVNIPDKSKQTPLIYMINNVQYENIEIFKKLINCNANINGKYNGDSPLILSITKKRIKYTKILLEQPCINVNQTNNKNKTILSIMIDNKISNEEIFDLLFTKGAYIDITYFNSNTLVKLIQSNEGLLKSIIHHGIITKKKNEILYITTPLIYFIKSSRNEIVEKLIKYGAIVEESDEKGFTPLFHSIRSNNSYAFHLLINNGHVDITKKNLYNQTPLSYAIKRNKNSQMVHELKKLLKLKSQEETSINKNESKNCLSNSINIMQYKENDERNVFNNKLLNNKFDSDNKPDGKKAFIIDKNNSPIKSENNNRSNEGKSNKVVKDKNIILRKPPSLTSSINKFDISNYLNTGKIEGNTNINKSLLLIDEELDTDDDNDDNYIFKEDIYNKINDNNNIDNLSDDDNNSEIDNSSDVDINVYPNKIQNNIIDEIIYPEFHYACLNENEDFIKLFINDFHYDVNEPCNDGSTPLFISIKYGKLKSIPILLKNNADIQKPDNQGETPISYVLKHSSIINNEILKLLLPYIKMKNTYYPDNLSPLNYLIKYNNISGFSVIFKANNFNIDEIDNDGNTPLLYAMKNFINNEELIEKIISYGANVDFIDMEGKVPLFYAIEYGKLNIFKLLIKYNANIEYQAPNGLTPLKLTVFKNDISFAKIILEIKKKNMKN